MWGRVHGTRLYWEYFKDPLAQCPLITSKQVTAGSITLGHLSVGAGGCRQLPNVHKAFLRVCFACRAFGSSKTNSSCLKHDLRSSGFHDSIQERRWDPPRKGLASWEGIDKGLPDNPGKKEVLFASACASKPVPPIKSRTKIQAVKLQSCLFSEAGWRSSVR